MIAAGDAGHAISRSLGRRMARKLGQVALLGSALCFGPAHGQAEPLRLAVILPACPGQAERERALLRSFQLELESDGIASLAPARRAGDASLAVDYPCAAALENVRLHLRLSDNAAADRWVRLADAPVALRPRALALAMAELLRASWPRPHTPSLTRASARFDTRGGSAREPSARSSPAHPTTANAPPAVVSTAADAAASEAPPASSGSPNATSAAPVMPATKAPSPAPPPDPATEASVPADEPHSSRESPSRTDKPRASREPRSGADEPRASVESRSADESRASPESRDRADEPRASRERAPAERAGPERATTNRPFSVWLVPEFRLALAEPNALVGGQGALRWRRLALGAIGLVGRRRDDLGAMRYGLAQATVGCDVLRASRGRYLLLGSARGAFGVAWGSARARTDAQAYSAAFPAWDVAAQLALLRALRGAWSLALLLEGGYAGGPSFTAETSDDQRTLVTFAGAFVGAALGFAYGFGG